MLYFLKNNLPYERESGEIVYPVVFVQAPEKPDLSRFYDYVLDALKIPYRRSAPLSHREALIEQAFEEYSVKLTLGEHAQAEGVHERSQESDQLYEETPCPCGN